MQHLVFYESTTGLKGNVDCQFLHNPPHLEDIRNLEADISKRFCNSAPAVVTGWKEIQDPDDVEKSQYSDFIHITIRGQEVNPEDHIAITTAEGKCIYIVALGMYEFEGKNHVGWHMKISTIGEGIDNSKVINLRSIADLVYDKSIIEWSILPQSK